MDSEPLVDIRDLSIAFNNDGVLQEAVKQVKLRVNRGERITLVGESGSGKTITVRSLIGLVPGAVYTGGSIIYNGRDLLRNKEQDWAVIRGREISMVFQDPMTALNPVFTIGKQMENVYLYQGKKNIPFPGRVKKEVRQQARRRSLELIEKMRLPNPPLILERYPFELSGGQRQRIVIALALIHTPKLLIADEPGTALDVTVQASINEELRRLVVEEGISMIYITHNLGVAKAMGERTYVMQLGEIVEEGSTDTIFLNPRQEYTKNLLKALPKLV